MSRRMHARQRCICHAGRSRLQPCAADLHSSAQHLVKQPVTYKVMRGRLPAQVRARRLVALSTLRERRYSSDTACDSPPCSAQHRHMRPADTCLPPSTARLHGGVVPQRGRRAAAQRGARAQRRQPHAQQRRHGHRALPPRARQRYGRVCASRAPLAGALNPPALPPDTAPQRIQLGRGLWRSRAAAPRTSGQRQPGLHIWLSCCGAGVRPGSAAAPCAGAQRPHDTGMLRPTAYPAGRRARACTAERPRRPAATHAAAAR